jgi:mono/diheme cytochrome c family protein
MSLGEYSLRRTALWIVILACVSVFAWAYTRSAEVEHGEAAFRQAGCGACHNSGGAPNLANVTRRYEKKKLKQFILDPDQVYRDRGMQSLNPGYPRMPKPGVPPSDADTIVAYLDTLTN